jgi:hypothetical protein
MLFRGIIAVYCENHMEHINTLCGQIAEFSYVKARGTYSNHCASKGLSSYYSRDNSVSIVNRLRAGRPRNRGSVPDRDKRFSLAASRRALTDCYIAAGSRQHSDS